MNHAEVDLRPLLVAYALSISIFLPPGFADDRGPEPPEQNPPSDTASAVEEILGFISGPSDLIDFLDEKGNPIPGWGASGLEQPATIGKLIRGGAAYAELPATKIRVTVPDSMLRCMAATHARLMGDSSEKRSPNRILWNGDAALLESHVLRQLCDFSNPQYETFETLGPSWKVGIRGAIYANNDGCLEVALKRMLLVTGDRMAERDPSFIGRVAIVCEPNVQSEVAFILPRVFGSDAFLQACKRHPSLRHCMENPCEYSQRYLQDSVDLIEEGNTALRKELLDVTEISRREAANVVSIADDLQRLGLDRQQATQAARDIASRRGRQVSDLLAQFLAPSEDPVGVGLKLTKALEALQHSLPSAANAYLYSPFGDRFGVLAEDIDGLWLLDFGSALSVHGKFFEAALKAARDPSQRQRSVETRAGRAAEDSQLWGERSLDAEASSGQFSADDLRALVARLSLKDVLTKGRVHGIGRRFPDKPEIPVKPEDPWVIEARNMQSQLETAAFSQEVARREMLAKRAAMRGDIEGFFAQQQAIGAAAAVASGSGELQSAYGAAAGVAAMDAQRRAVAASSAIRRPADYESTPQWRHYLTEMERYRDAMERYQKKRFEWESAIDQHASELEAFFTTKQQAAIKDIDSVSHSAFDVARRVERFVKSSTNVASEPSESCFVLPPLDYLILSSSFERFSADKAPAVRQRMRPGMR